MAHKLNVIAACRGALFVSPRKVREDIGSIGEGLRLYLTDLWLYQARPARPFKFRRGASLVLRIAAHDGIPDVCWEVTTCQGLRTKEEANQYFADVSMQLMRSDAEELRQEYARKWYEGRFLHRLHRPHYYPVFQEKRDDEVDNTYYQDYSANQ